MLSWNQRVHLSLQLMRSSFLVIWRNPKHSLYPAIIFVSAVVAVFFFLTPVYLIPTGHALGSDEHVQAAFLRLITPFSKGPLPLSERTAAFSYLALIYLGSMFLATFFNVAFHHEIMKALAGQSVSLRRGFAAAVERLPAIFWWSMFAGTIGLLLSLLGNRLHGLARWLIRGVGMVWSMASIFVIPALIRNREANPLQLVRLSGATLKRTWGESVTAYLGVTLGSAVGLLALIAAIVSGFLLGQLTGLKLLMALPLLGGLLCVIAFFYYSTTLNCVLRCALYIYASEGEVPVPFTAEQLDAAWKIKKFPQSDRA